MNSSAEQPAIIRIHTGELISATSALLLAPIMFTLAWYGVVGLPRSSRSGITTAASAWQVLTYTRWLMLAAIGVALGSLGLHVSQRTHGTKTDTGPVVATVGTATALLLIYRVLIELPSPSSVVDVKLGAFLGTLAAIGIAVGGYETIREERVQRGAVVQKSRRRRRLVSRSKAR